MVPFSQCLMFASKATRVKDLIWLSRNTWGEVSQYHWRPVWLVLNQLYDNGQTGVQQYSDNSPFSVLWTKV